MPLKSERDQAPVARFGPRTRALATVAALCAVITISRAETSAFPGCDADLPPSIYSSVGAAPNIEIWKQPNLAGLPPQASCLGLAAPDLRMLVTVAGTFENPGGAPAILARFGEVSKLLQYVTGQPLKKNGVPWYWLPLH